MRSFGNDALVRTHVGHVEVLVLLEPDVLARQLGALLITGNNPEDETAGDYPAD